MKTIAQLKQSLKDKKEEKKKEEDIEFQITTLQKQVSELKRDAEPILKSPSMAAQLSSTVFGQMKAFFHKAYVLEFGDGFLSKHYVVESKERYLKCKGKTFLRETKPMISKMGYHYYIVNAGDNKTTSEIDIKRDLYKNRRERDKNKLTADGFNDLQKYEVALEIAKARSVSGLNILMLVFAAFVGFAIASIYFSATMDEGDDYEIGGNYYDRDETNINDNDGTNNDNNNDVVVVP